MKRNMFVSLSDAPVAFKGPEKSRALLAAIEVTFGCLYDIHECIFDFHPSFGRGSNGHLEWREPPVTFAHVLIVAPLQSFVTDVQFELRRPPTVFPIPALVLQRCVNARKTIDIGNITFSSEAPVKKHTWRHAHQGRALALIRSFLEDFGLPSSTAIATG